MVGTGAYCVSMMNSNEAVFLFDAELMIDIRRSRS
jgi:hypothetical protein